MADSAYRVPGAGTPWGAIWAGVFSFAAIWSIFGLLGAAIFGLIGGAGSAAAGMGWGMGIWSIVLTMIAMFVGARVTSSLAGPASRGEGILYGQTMFGLAVVSTIVLLILRGVAINLNMTMSHGVTLALSTRWFGFVALFLGWLCAIGGASSARMAERQAATVHDIRTAA